MTKMVVLNRGRVEQFATPAEIYDRPASLFVNRFVGAVNMLPSIVRAVDAEGAEVAIEGNVVVRARCLVAVAPGSRVTVSIRPESLAPYGDGGLAATLEFALPLGAAIVHERRATGGTALKMTTPRRFGEAPLPPGTALRLAKRDLATAHPA